MSVFVRNYNQQMQSILLSIGERVALLGQRIDRAVTISQTLQTRKLAHYAVVVAACLSVFPALSAVNSATPIFATYFCKPQMEIWAYLAAGVITIIFSGTMLLRWGLKRVGALREAQSYQIVSQPTKGRDVVAFFYGKATQLLYQGDPVAGRQTHNRSCQVGLRKRQGRLANAICGQFP